MVPGLVSEMRGAHAPEQLSVESQPRELRLSAAQDAPVAIYRQLPLCAWVGTRFFVVNTFEDCTAEQS